MPYIVVNSQYAGRLYAIKWVLFSSIFIVTGVLFILLGTFIGLFSDFDVSQREQRIRIYVVAWILVFFYWIVSLFFKGVFFPISIIAFGLLVGIFFFTLINRFIKASIHMALACAFVITISIFWKGDTFFKIFWIIPLLMWSRLTLKKHNVQEVIVGSLTGTILTLLTFLLGKLLYQA